MAHDINQSVSIDGSINGGTTGGILTAYTLTIPGWTTLVTQTQFTVKVNANSGVAPTLNIGGTGALALVKPNGTAIGASELLTT